MTAPCGGENEGGLIAALPPSPFRRLAALLEGIEPKQDAIDLSLGELKHPFPPLAKKILHAQAEQFGRYPPIHAVPELKDAIKTFLARRFNLSLSDAALAILPLSGSREGLFSLPLALPHPERPLIAMPDPCYAAYPAGTLAASARPLFMPTTKERGFLPDFASLPENKAKQLRAIFVCAPANPQGAAAEFAYWQTLIKFTRQWDIPLLVDEAYSDLYLANPPMGALEAAQKMNDDANNPFAGVVVFHSLSKRVAMPGLRSGFCAGDPVLLGQYAKLRQVGSPQMPLPVQLASAALWRDEDCPAQIRKSLRKKFALAKKILAPKADIIIPDGGFFLWLESGESLGAARLLWREGGVKILPGALLSFSPDKASTGNQFIRIALVEKEARLEEAFARAAALL